MMVRRTCGNIYIFKAERLPTMSTTRQRCWAGLNELALAESQELSEQLASNDMCFHKERPERGFCRPPAFLPFITGSWCLHSSKLYFFSTVFCWHNECTYYYPLVKEQNKSDFLGYSRVILPCMKSMAQGELYYFMIIRIELLHLFHSYLEMQENLCLVR